MRTRDHSNRNGQSREVIEKLYIFIIKYLVGIETNRWTCESTIQASKGLTNDAVLFFTAGIREDN